MELYSQHYLIDKSSTIEPQFHPREMCPSQSTGSSIFLYSCSYNDHRNHLPFPCLFLVDPTSKGRLLKSILLRSVAHICEIYFCTSQVLDAQTLVLMFRCLTTAPAAVPLSVTLFFSGILICCSSNAECFNSVTLGDNFIT